MLVGQFRSRRPDRHVAPNDRRAIIIGAGIAGSTTPIGWPRPAGRSPCWNRPPKPGQGASSNLAGMLRPLPSADDNRLSRLTRAGFLATRALLAELPDVRWSPCGVMHLAAKPNTKRSKRAPSKQLGLPPELMQFVDKDEASRKLELAGRHRWLVVPEGGWVQPPSLCRAALAAYPERITTIFNAAVDRIKRTKTGWQALDADGSRARRSAGLIMASGVVAPRFEQFAWLPQTSRPAARSATCRAAHARARIVVLFQTRLRDAGHRRHPLIGASCLLRRRRDRRTPSPITADNLARLA
jgi:tRNA 5-methylaminomethyl-2-thiouridine biosynthesis bifunctional protein